MLKFRKVSYLFIAVLGLLLILNACGRKGELNINLKPVIMITSYEGSDNAGCLDDPTLFQQKIYWDAFDYDGTVQAYAFRVVDVTGDPYKDENGDPIGTPGYEFVDDQGWVYHYQDGADETIPMDDPEAKISIWTTQVYAEINFPANGEQIFDEFGDPVIDEFGNPVFAPVTSIFEVKCIDNSGEENDQNFPVRKYFNSFSATPMVTIESSQGDISTRTIGTGIYFQFNIRDNDQYVGEIPYYFFFRLEKRDLDGVVIPFADGGYDTTWISTKGQTDVTRFLMTQGTDPALSPNFSIDDPVVNDSTYIIAKAVDIAGIVSDPDTISFLVYDGFHPGSLIYSGDNIGDGCDIWLIGENHFTTYLDGSITKIIEEEDTSEGKHFSLPFWINKDGEYAVLGSNDLKIYAHWGWHGEYGQLTQGEPNITDNPNDLVVGALKDEDTDASYYSEMKYFDVRLDGEPYYYPPLPPQGDNLQVDETGKEWLRIPINHEIAQNAVLTSLSDGLHRLEVRAVDLQDAGDPTPADLDFRVVNRVPRNEKEGILIIDDDNNHPFFAPDEVLDCMYEDFLSGYSGSIDVIDRKELIDNNIWKPQLHFNRDVFSPTDLEKYKLVIYHSDYLTIDSNFQKEFEVLELYLRGGGNLILSGGKNLINTLNSLEGEWASTIFEEYFGLSNADGDVIKVVTKDGAEASFMQLQYFIKAYAETSPYQDIDLYLYTDLNGNGIYDEAEPFTDWSGNEQYDESIDEPFEDLNENGIYDDNEPFTDWNENEQWDESLSEPFEDLNNNGIYDDAEPKCFNSLVFGSEALGPVVYFDENNLSDDVEVLYRFGCKEPGDGPLDPSAAEFEEYTGQPVAIRKVTDNNSCYIFGFPLSYMNVEQVNTMMLEIINDN